MSNDLYFLFLKQLIHCLLALDLSKGSSIQNFLPSPLSFLVLLQRQSIRKYMITLVTFKRFISRIIKKETYYCSLALALTKSSSIPPKPSSLAACSTRIISSNIQFYLNSGEFYQTFHLKGSFPSQVLQAWLGPSRKHCLHQQGVACPEYD